MSLVLMSSSWTTTGRTPAKLPVSWSYRYSVVTQKQVRFKDYGKVTNSRQFAFNLEKRFPVFRQVSFRNLSQARCFSTSRFNTYFKVAVKDWSLVSASPGAISTGIVHPIDFTYPAARPAYYGLTRAVTYPIDYQLNPTSGLTPVAGIQFRTGTNPSGRVSATKAVQFNALNTVSVRKASSFGVVNRFTIKNYMLFNIYNGASRQVSSSWITGPVIPGRIRQLAQVRMDFAY